MILNPETNDTFSSLSADKTIPFINSYTNLNRDVNHAGRSKPDENINFPKTWPKVLKH